MSNVRSIGAAKATPRKSTHGEASEWLVLLETGEATAEDRARCEAWLREHPGHRAAFDELKDTWGRLHSMGEHARRTGVIGPDPDAVVKYLARSAGVGKRGRWLGWSAAATLVVAIAAGMLLYPYGSPALYRTNVGQQETITLPDRSTVQLNTNTEVRVVYSRHERNVELRRGEAYFDVELDAARPFVVNAGLGTIRAVGTGFVVQMRRNETVAVTVTEGVVEVTHGGRGGTGVSLPAVEEIELSIPKLSKGQRIEYDRKVGSPAEVPAEELDRSLAWRQGLLVFDGESLAEVIEEVGRYTDTRLEISDSELRQLRIGGAFRAGDVEALLEVLEKSFNIGVIRDGSRVIYLNAGHQSVGD